ncbi:MAG: hypothetical protein HKN11_20180 [Rhizobiales bacterium]|nr:hypothetical protein [Hyphomicrobiales bacterium]
MLAKILTATLTAALAYMVMRQIKQYNDKARERVKTRRSDDGERVVTLREDPDTGVFRPSEHD